MTHIPCPHCHQKINIEDALVHQLTEQFHAKHIAEKEQLELEATERIEKERKAIEQAVFSKYDDQYRLELEMLRKQNESRSKELQLFKQRELELRKEKQHLEELQQTVDLEIRR